MESKTNWKTLTIIIAVIVLVGFGAYAVTENYNPVSPLYGWMMPNMYCGNIQARGNWTDNSSPYQPNPWCWRNPDNNNSSTQESLDGQPVPNNQVPYNGRGYGRGYGQGMGMRNGQGYGAGNGNCYWR